MARTSNRAEKKMAKKAEVTTGFNYPDIDGNREHDNVCRVYGVAVYIRLSNEDDRKIASNTIENQLELLRDFVNSQNDLEIVEEYCDRGVTGTRFDRPEFTRMIQDMKLGKFNCIVVKDLSRLGRNYLEAGDYLEKIFPLYGIRFISVADNFDTLHSNPTEDGIIVPLKNLINEAYAKDISQRICVSKELMQRRGQFVGTQPPYGYLKDPNDLHHLIPDPDTKDIVADMFTRRSMGESATSIARMLNNKGILAPVAYRISKGMEKNQKYKKSKWDVALVTSILQNPAYIGDMEQGLQKGALYRGIPDHRQSKDKRIYVKQTHEPIVDKTIYYKVQELLKEIRTRHMKCQNKYKDVHKKEDIFRGLLYCADCGTKLSLYRRTCMLSSGTYNYYTYFCRNTPVRDECTKKNFKMEKLEEIITELINTHIRLYLQKEDVLKMYNRTAKIAGIRNDIQEKITKNNKEITSIQSRMQNLYEDLKDETIDENEYISLKSSYSDRLNELDKELTSLKNDMEKYDADAIVDNDTTKNMRKFIGFKELTREIVVAFIKKITFYDNKRIKVEYTFENKMSELDELIEERKAICSME